MADPTRVVREATRQRRLRALAREASGCRRCGLWKRGTQTVSGQGPVGARLMLVGEQPGDDDLRAVWHRLQML
jgi:DNA polymerase